MSHRSVIRTLPWLMIVVLFVGCLPVEGGRLGDDRAGFFTGIWHGWIAPISLVVSIFDSSVRIYEVHNTGWWYDLGFYMAIISGFGSLALVRRKEQRTA